MNGPKGHGPIQANFAHMTFGAILANYAHMTFGAIRANFAHMAFGAIQAAAYGHFLHIGLV